MNSKAVGSPFPRIFPIDVTVAWGSGSCPRIRSPAGGASECTFGGGLASTLTKSTLVTKGVVSEILSHGTIDQGDDSGMIC